MRFALVVALLTAIWPGSAFGCSMRGYTEPIQVKPDLVVKITHREKPAAGITVTLQKTVEGGPERPAEPMIFTTNADGTAHIQGLAMGEYWLSATYLDIEAGREWIKVDPAAHKRKGELSFQWGDNGTAVRTIVGTLTSFKPGNTGSKIMDVVHKQRIRIYSAEITLKAAFSDEQYRTLSDSKGEFIIDPVPPGTYLLTISGGTYFSESVSDSHQLVYVSESNDPHPLNFVAAQGGCAAGVYYTLDSSPN